MGRPKEHDAATGAALLAAAERQIAAQGLNQLSVRAVASEVGTTTRAIYSVFGSKDELVAALGSRMFDLLGRAVRDALVTTDPVVDLVNAGAIVFRGVAIEHPVLFALGVQRTNAKPGQRGPLEVAAGYAWTALQERVARTLAPAQTSGWTVDEAATAFHALCEGLAALEIRGLIPPVNAADFWRKSLTALVEGFHTDTSGGDAG